MAKEILCGFGVHVDAVAGWLGSYGGEDSPNDIRGHVRGGWQPGGWSRSNARNQDEPSIEAHWIDTFLEQMKAVGGGWYEN